MIANMRMRESWNFPRYLAAYTPSATPKITAKLIAKKISSSVAGRRSAISWSMGCLVERE